MRRNIVMLLVALTVGATTFALSSSGSSGSIENCPKRGTPACPIYPACCNGE